MARGDDHSLGNDPYQYKYTEGKRHCEQTPKSQNQSYYSHTISLLVQIVYVGLPAASHISIQLTSIVKRFSKLYPAVFTINASSGKML